MGNKDKSLLFSSFEENILGQIFYIRKCRVMIDRDLAVLYGVETRVLNQAVKRNIKRFPNDFMFKLSDREFSNWKSQIVITNREKMGLRKPPLVFTEQGIAMLSSILNSEIAVQVNIQIIRVFSKMRDHLESQQDIVRRLELLEKKGMLHEKNILLILEYIKGIEEQGQIEKNQQDRKRIGYK